MLTTCYVVDDDDDVVAAAGESLEIRDKNVASSKPADCATRLLVQDASRGWIFPQLLSMSIATLPLLVLS